MEDPRLACQRCGAPARLPVPGGGVGALVGRKCAACSRDCCPSCSVRNAKPAICRDCLARRAPGGRSRWLPARLPSSTRHV